MKKYFRVKQIKPPEVASDLSNENKSIEQLSIQLLQDVKQLNQHFQKNNKNQNNFLRFLVIGMMQGFGTILGATILVALFLYLLRPFTNVDWIRPYVDQVIQIIQRHSKPG